MSTSPRLRPNWTALPDELICLIMDDYKKGLHERMASRPPVVLHYGAGKTYCEVCDRKKKKVAWKANTI